MHWLYLAIAIVLEIIATSALKYSQGFTKLVPSLVVVVGYLAAFYFLSLTLKTMSVGIAYAIWSGAGIVLMTIVGYFAFQQKLDLPALIALSFIIVGILILKVCSKTVV